MGTYGVKILGTGTCIPEKILTNADLEKMVETSDDWITQRTGIKERHIASDTTATSDIAISASRIALSEAKLTPADIDLIMVATVTPDMFFPSTACFVQKGLGAVNAAAFDLAAACSGFVYGMTIARSFIESGMYKNILLIGAETLSKVTDWQDRNTCILFGDAAGAMVLGRSDSKESAILSSYLGADGNCDTLLYLPGAGSRHPVTPQTIADRMHYIKMNGRETFKEAVPHMAEAAAKAIELSGIPKEDIKLVIPHQANIRIIEAVAKRLDLPEDRVYVNVNKYGNTSSATTIVALDEARREGRVAAGDYVTLVAFGGGFTWGAVVIRL